MTHKRALDRTFDKMSGDWKYNNHRLNQAVRFIKKAVKSDKKRKVEKASRKRNRNK